MTAFEISCLLILSTTSAKSAPTVYFSLSHLPPYNPWQINEGLKVQSLQDNGNLPDKTKTWRSSVTRKTHILGLQMLSHLPLSDPDPGQSRRAPYSLYPSMQGGLREMKAPQQWQLRHCYPSGINPNHGRENIPGYLFVSIFAFLQGVLVCSQTVD